jgi:hypothetical protein
MTDPILTNIQKSQAEYLNLVLSHSKAINKDKNCANNIGMMLDDVKVFWIERLNIIEFELEELTEKYCCFLLSGAIYLDVSEYEHYYFKSLGDYQLLYDPFLKMEQFFRLPTDKIDMDYVGAYLKKVYKDTFQILTNYNTQFYILPIRQIAIDSEEEQFEILNKSFLNFLSSAFDDNFSSQQEFCDKYNSYEDIEKAMAPYIREHLILSEIDGTDSPLRDKISSYMATQMNIQKLVEDKSEAQIFCISVFSWYSQIVDTLLVCTRLRINPFIRFNITFHYLSLILHAFSEDTVLKKMIEKTIIFYVFYKTIDMKLFRNITFSEYSSRMREEKLLDHIVERLDIEKIDIFKGGLARLQAIIAEEFNKVL